MGESGLTFTHVETELDVDEIINLVMESWDENRLNSALDY